MTGEMVDQQAPRLYGDGIHDDTDALQWRVDHAADLSDFPGKYRISRTLRVTFSNQRVGFLHLIADGTVSPAIDLAQAGLEGTNLFDGFIIEGTRSGIRMRGASLSTMSDDKTFEVTIKVRDKDGEAVRHLEGPMDHRTSDDVAAEIVGVLDSRSRGRIRSVPGTDR